MNRKFLRARGITRRELARAGLSGAAALCALGGLPAGGVFGRIAHAIAAPSGWGPGAPERRILVVLAMSGGNDGLNTVVPYRDDAYYRQRPTIGIKPHEVLRLDEHFGLNPGMVAFARLWQAGDLAIVHGCGYEDPASAHRAAMACWHSAGADRAIGQGWLGRLADGLRPGGAPASLVDLGATPARAQSSRDHPPVVLGRSGELRRVDRLEERARREHAAEQAADGKPPRQSLRAGAPSGLDASALARAAGADYRTPVDYGPAPLDLRRIAALIAADAPARLYYASSGAHAFDTHVHQAALHRRLLAGSADAIAAFLADVARLGRADDVLVLVFSEFGRRLAENRSLGTDHGTAGPMFVIGRPVEGGHYGAAPSLSALLAGGHLRHTTDFRRVYATAAGWLGCADTRDLLGDEFPRLPVFG